MNIDDSVVQLQIFDTAGQERYRSIVSSYYRQANAIIITFDLTSRESFDNISYWITQANNNSEPNCFKAIVGTKSDLTDKRTVKREECEDVAQQYNCRYFETSALSDENVSEMFVEIAKETKKHAKKHNKEKAVKTEEPKAEEQSCC